MRKHWLQDLSSHMAVNSLVLTMVTRDMTHSYLCEYASHVANKYTCKQTPMHINSYDLKIYIKIITVLEKNYFKISFTIG